jgi:hypothetical protein
MGGYPATGRGRLAVWRQIFDHRWVKGAISAWAAIAAYDTFISQILPENLAPPKIREIAVMTSGWLPFWGWLLVLAAIMVGAALEYAFRRASAKAVLQETTKRMESWHLIAIGLVGAFLFILIAFAGLAWQRFQQPQIEIAASAPPAPPPTTSTVPQVPLPLLTHKYTAREAQQLLDNELPRLAELLKAAQDVPIPTELYAVEIGRVGALPRAIKFTWQENIKKMGVSVAINRLQALSQQLRPAFRAIVEFVNKSGSASDDLGRIAGIAGIPPDIVMIVSGPADPLERAISGYVQKLHLLEAIPTDKLTDDLMAHLLNEPVNTFAKAVNDYQAFYRNILSDKTPAMRRELEKFL